MVLTILAAGCKKSGSGSSPAPGAATLLLPLKDQVCTTGTTVTDSTSTINFSWQQTQDANNYELTVKNLNSQAVITKTLSGTQQAITLSKNTPYSWYITSKSNNTQVTTKSAVWKFYNAGNGVVSYAPYPAEIVAPLLGKHVTSTNGKINLSWKGSVPSGAKIVSYSVYFGPANNPALFRQNIKDEFVNDVVVSAATTYYWHVVTVDSNNNIADSGMYNFYVEQ